MRSWAWTRTTGGSYGRVIQRNPGRTGWSCASESSASASWLLGDVLLLPGGDLAALTERARRATAAG
jgi:hypothetical protein